MLVGVSAAVTMELSTGLLLYSDSGFLPALTLILTVECAAVALGLWSGATPGRDSAVEQLRRWWFMALVAFAVAAALSAGRTFWEGSGNGALAQGVGLALLGGLPLFTLGALFGAMAAKEGPKGPPVERVAVPGVLGVAGGFLIAGGVLIPNLAPYSIFLLCLVALSGGALLQGWVLDLRLAVEIREKRLTPLGSLSVEDRAVGSPRKEVRILLEEGRIRGGEGSGGEPARAWEAALVAGLAAQGKDPGPVLYLGGGSGTAARALSEVFPGLRLTLVERNPLLLEMAGEHLTAVGEEVDVRYLAGDPFLLLESMQDRYPLVLVDGQGLPMLGGQPHLREGDWRLLKETAGNAGVVFFGGLYIPEGGPDQLLDPLVRGAGVWFQKMGVLVEEAPGIGAALFPDLSRGSEACLIFGEVQEAEWALHLPGFALEVLGEG
jgi:hypothetical protein